MCLIAEVAENEVNRNVNIDLDMKYFPAKSDVLFYVKGATNVGMNDLRNIYWQGRDPDSDETTVLQKFRQSDLHEIKKDDLRNIIFNLSSTFDELFRKYNPNPEGPNINLDRIDGFSLNEIELNFNVEVKGSILFSLSAKGDAGLKLVFKRK